MIKSGIMLKDTFNSKHAKTLMSKFSSYHVSQNVVIALCILAVFNNLEDREEKRRINHVIYTGVVLVCAQLRERGEVSDSSAASYLLLDLVQDCEEVG